MPTNEDKLKKGFWFKSELFRITNDEDLETNPGCYGKELGEWLCEKLKGFGYREIKLVAEDWGWCVICSDIDYFLWVGCVSILPEEFNQTYNPNKPAITEDITWHVFTVAEVPIIKFKSWTKKLFRQLDLQQPLNKLNNELEVILNAEPKIVQCDEP